jgi:hypothetical protein
MRVI